MRFESHAPNSFPKVELISGERTNGDPNMFLQGSSNYTQNFPADYYGESENPYLAQLYIAMIKMAASKGIAVDKHHDIFLRTTEANGYEDETGLSGKFPSTANSVFNANEYSEAANIWQHMTTISFLSWAFALHTTCIAYKKEWMFNPLLALSKQRDELVSIPQAEVLLQGMGKTGYEKLIQKKSLSHEEYLDTYDRALFLNKVISETGDLPFSLQIVQETPLYLLAELYPDSKTSVGSNF